MTDVWVWTKRIAPAEEGAWETRLDDLAEGRYAVTGHTGRRLLRVQIFAQNELEARELQRHLGGRVDRWDEKRWREPGAGAPRRTATKIRNRVIVTSDTDAAELAAQRKRHPGRIVLGIPADLAFGTGEHATTATSLRLLADLARERDREKRRGGRREWNLLDLGTGTGVLAMAGKALGAGPVEGWENDPLAVAVAEKNIRVNGFSPENVAIRLRDALKWNPNTPSWDVITANMFSNILVTLFPRIQRALKPGGAVIVSGILREQEAETLAAAEHAGLAPHTLKRVGKWVTARLEVKSGGSLALASPLRHA